MYVISIHFFRLLYHRVSLLFVIDFILLILYPHITSFSLNSIENIDANLKYVCY